jgi:hypothetical protein
MDARDRWLTQQGQTGAWVEIDDNEQMVYVDLECTDVPDTKQFVKDCHHLAGELGYGILFNGLTADGRIPEQADR